MNYEPGTKDCLVLIESKCQIESMLLRLSKIENAGPVVDQLTSVYNQLEELHSLHRQNLKTKQNTEAVDN